MWDCGRNHRGPSSNSRQTVHATQQAKPFPESRVKRKGMSVLLFLLGAALAAHSSESQPVSSAQLMAWLTAGVPCNRLVRMVQEHGIASVPGKKQIHQLEAAGADPTLIRTLTRTPTQDESKAVGFFRLVGFGVCGLRDSGSSSTGRLRCPGSTLSRSRTCAAPGPEFRSRECLAALRPGGDAPAAGAIGRCFRRDHALRAAHARLP